MCHFGQQVANGERGIWQKANKNNGFQLKSHNAGDENLIKMRSNFFRFLGVDLGFLDEISHYPSAHLGRYYAFLSYARGFYGLTLIVLPPLPELPPSFSGPG